MSGNGTTIGETRALIAAITGIEPEHVGHWAIAFELTGGAEHLAPGGVGVSHCCTGQTAARLLAQGVIAALDEEGT